MKINFIKSVSILSITIAIVSSCNSTSGGNTDTEAEKSKVINYNPTLLPSDTTDLWIADGSHESDTVLILSQGGPQKSLGFAESKKSQYRYIKNYENYLKIHLHQANTYNPEMFGFKKEFTLEMAKKETKNNSEIVYRAIKYFKDRNKTVIVSGHSYGAFVVAHYLANKPSIADRYIMISGRIDADEVNVKNNLKGLNGSFEEGVFMPDNIDEILQRSEEEQKVYRVKQLLKAAIGEPRYSIALANKDLSNVIFIYSIGDSRVGQLSEKEIAFLKSKNASVFSTEHPHGSSIWALTDVIKEDKVRL